MNDNFGIWFSGFFDGEGSLSCYRDKNDVINYGIEIAQRADDVWIKAVIEKNLPVFTYKARTETSLMNVFKISKTSLLVDTIIPMFDKYHLMSKKRFEYQLWREGVVLKYFVISNPDTRKRKDEIELVHNLVSFGIHVVRSGGGAARVVDYSVIVRVLTHSFYDKFPEWQALSGKGWTCPDCGKSNCLDDAVRESLAEYEKKTGEHIEFPLNA